MSYQSYAVSLTEGQKANLARAYKNRSPITIRLMNDQFKRNFPLLLTKTQINRINKADKTRVNINISKNQISAQSENGGFLGAFASFFFLARTVLPTVAKIAPKVVAPLATGALKQPTTNISRFPSKATRITQTGPYLISQMLKSSKLKLTKKQSQDGGFLP